MEEVKCQCNSGTVDVETQGNFSLMVSFTAGLSDKSSWKLFEDLFGYAMPIDS